MSLTSESSSIVAQTSLRHDTPGIVARSLKAHGVFLAIAVGYFLLALASLAFYPPPRSGAAWQVFVVVLTGMAVFLPLVVITREFYAMVTSERPKSPTLRLAQRIAAFVRDPLRMAAGLPMLLATTLFIFDFAVLKSQIAAIAPFSWDLTLDGWDKALHFGYRPWELLQPVLGSGPVTFLINVNYNIWFVVMNLMLLHFTFYERPGEVRTHFMLTFMVTWMLGGTLLAMVFSSAGPCYVEAMGLGSEAYGPLMQRLHVINETWPIWALETQDMLWSLKREGSLMGGISAMPSMHNATVLLFIFTCWHWGRWFRFASIAHAVLIFLGSIHLGWHYAADAYVAFALVSLIWLAMRPLARWWHGRDSVAAFDREMAGRTAASGGLRPS